LPDPHTHEVLPCGCPDPLGATADRSGPLSRRQLVVAAGGLLAASALVDLSRATHGALASGGSTTHWSYRGATGPSHWGSLDPTFALCSRGSKQSPIDLRHARPAALPPIKLGYRPLRATPLNNGHTIQFPFENGSSIEIRGHRYKLSQFHFHAPAEHLLSGRRFEMELHLVHMDAAKNAAVLGVLIRRGRANPAFERLFAHLPHHEGKGRRLARPFDPARMLPRGGGRAPYFAYDGSLTTPPCTQGVHWMVFRQPVELSGAQIARFRAIFPHDSRPVQPLRGRQLRVSGG
jgi:carbonic anhydrase